MNKDIQKSEGGIQQEQKFERKNNRFYGKKPGLEKMVEKK